MSYLHILKNILYCAHSFVFISELNIPLSKYISEMFRDTSHANANNILKLLPNSPVNFGRELRI